MNATDFIIIFLLLLAALDGWRTGFLALLIDLVAFVIGLVLAFVFAEPVGALFGGWLSFSVGLQPLFGFAAVFLLCAGLIKSLPPRPLSAWAAAIQATEATCQRVMQSYCQSHFFDGAVVAAVVNALLAGARLMIGNSLPVRHLDQFGAPSTQMLNIFGNRGASGIDGVTSTALGIAAASDAPLVLLTGDIAFYHDMNGLLAIQQHKLRNVTIVLLNNNGGSIFRRLPVAKFEPAFTPLFLTPHGLDFSHVAQLYGLTFVRVAERSAFQTAFQQSINGSGSTLIEVQTDGAIDYQHQQAVVKQVKDLP